MMTPKLTFVLTFLFFTTVTISQVNLDSLKNVWEDSSFPDTSRIDALHQYTWKKYVFKQGDSAVYLGNIELQMAQEIKDLEREKKGIYTIGAAYLIMSKADSALFHFKKILKLAVEQDDNTWFISANRTIGAIYFKQSNYDIATRHFEAAIDSATEETSVKMMISLYNNMGAIKASIGKNEEALSYFKMGLSGALEIDDKKSQAQAYTNMGNIYSEMGDLKEGEKNYLLSVKIRENINDRRNLTSAYSNLGSLYKEQSKFPEAKATLFKSLALAIEYNDHYSNAKITNSIGGIYRTEGKVDSALYYFNKSIDMSKEIGDKLYLSSAYLNTALVYKETDNVNKAIPYLDSSLLIAKETGHIYNLKSVYRSYYLAYRVLDEPEKAAEHLLSLNDIREHELNNNYSFLTEEKKEFYYKTMEKDFHKYDSFTLDRKDDKPELVGQSFNYALKIKGLLLKSTSAMRNAILSSNDSLLIRDYNDWIEIKKEIAENYSGGNETSELEEKEKVLEAHLIKGSKDFSEFEDVHNLEWTDVQKKLKKDEVAIEFIRFEHQLDFSTDSLYEIVYCALILKSGSETPQMIRLFSEDELNKILGDFPGNNLAYIEQVYGTKEKPDNRLYSLIWKPMEETLLTSKKIYLSPIGLLHKVAFSAINKEKDVYLCDLYEMETTSSTGKIALSEESVIGKESSFVLFGGIDYNSDFTTKKIWSYLEGSESEAQEIYNITSKKRKNVNFYSGDKATEEIFKSEAPKGNVIHIATHGFFYADPEFIEQKTIVTETEENDDLAFRGGKDGFGVQSFVMNKNPLMRSGIVLAGANDVWDRSNKVDSVGNYKEDGVLTAQEVITIDMRNTDLVVLSACETGLGDIKGAEGVYGLQRSFKMAGVKFLIMSLWEVPDTETADFMTTFYKNLSKSGDIKDSFIKTQVLMRSKYDPYYWAAFVLIE